MESFYKTSIDLNQKPFLTQISNNTLYKNYNINIQSLTTSFQNLKTSSNFQNYNIMEKRRQILNNLFPYHLFNKFSVSFEKYLLKNNINIPLRIKLCKDKLNKEEELLQKIDNKKNEELLNKANYGPDFFIQFAKKKRNLTKAESKDIKLPNEPFKKRYSTFINLKNKQGQKKFKRAGFYEKILKEVNDEYEEIVRAKSLEIQKKKSNKKIVKKRRIRNFNTFDNLDDINNNNNNKKNIYSNLLKNRNKTNTNIINKKLVNKINKQFPKIINLKKILNVNIKTNRNNNDEHSEQLNNFITDNNHNNKTISNRKINSFIKYNKDRYKTLNINTNIMSNHRNNKYNSKYSLLDSKKSSSNLMINNKTIPNKNINNNI